MRATKTILSTADIGVQTLFPDFRPLFAVILGSLLILVPAIFLAFLRLESTRLGYELSNLYRQQEELAAEVGRLEVEEEFLSVPRRIEQWARDSGFTYPEQGGMVATDN